MEVRAGLHAAAAVCCLWRSGPAMNVCSAAAAPALAAGRTACGTLPHSRRRLAAPLPNGRQMIFALTAFSVVAEGNGASQINYCIFCGVTTFVFGLLFIACYLADVTWVSRRGREEQQGGRPAACALVFAHVGSAATLQRGPHSECCCCRARAGARPGAHGH